MSWKRLATFATGGALAVVSFLVPPAAPALGPAGAFLIGWALRWPGDKKKAPKTEDPTAVERLKR